MNKRRIRQLIRKFNWVAVDLEPRNDYHSLRSWCNSTFEKGTWEASLRGTEGQTRFVFASEQDATVFTLKWT